MASADEALRSTKEKVNFHRLTRLLVCGGGIILREKFDSFHSPVNLPTTLGSSRVKTLLGDAQLTRKMWNCLYPSEGQYGKSTDFDIILTFRLLRTICNLTPPATGWDSLPRSTDHSLEADLARVKYYRNEVYAHSTTMEISDAEFVDLWGDISDALLRIAASISQEKRNEWRKSIDTLLQDDLTAEVSIAITAFQAAGGSPNFWNVVLSYRKTLHMFFQYLRYKLKVTVRRFAQGSLLITVECGLLQILEDLWEDYQSGHLNQVAQETLISAEVLEKLGVTEVKLKTFISEKDYLEGKQILIANSGKSTIVRKQQ